MKQKTLTLLRKYQKKNIYHGEKIQKIIDDLISI